jgi:transposase
MASETLAAKRSAKIITLVMDNYGIHKPGAFYEVFSPQEAKGILNRFEFVYTPKHGSWLNMAEIELNVLMWDNVSIDTLITYQLSSWKSPLSKSTATTLTQK